MYSEKNRNFFRKTALQILSVTVVFLSISPSLHSSPDFIYIDRDVPASEPIYQTFKETKQQNSVLHLFSHGRPGQLLLEGKWRKVKEIAEWVKEKNLLRDIKHLNIYGCNFARGEEGAAALDYLGQELCISLAASDDITGADGDWELETGNTKGGIIVEDYAHNLQGYIDCATHLNSSFDYLYDYQSYSKTVNGFTYFATGYNYDPAFPPSYPIINGNPYDPANVATNSTSSNNGHDVYIAIWDPDCNQLFGTFIGGLGDDFAYGLDIDSEGNLIVVGGTESTNFPTTDGTNNTGTYSSMRQTFILKYAPDGTLLFSTVFGATDDSTDPQKVLADGTDIYVFGTNQGTDFPTTNSTSASEFLRNPFVRKYDGSGNLIFSSTWGSDDADDWPQDFTVLETGGVAVKGYTQSTNGSFPVTDGSSLTDNRAAYLTILDNTGNITFSTLFGAGSISNGKITSDGNGGIYVAGEVWGTLSTTDGTANVAFDDAYIRKYDLTGNLVFSTLLAGSSADNVDDIQFSNGSLYFMGNTGSVDFPTTDGTVAAGSSDIVLARYDPNGNLIFATMYGGASNDFTPPGFEVNAAGEIYLLHFANASPPTTDGTSGSGSVISKFNADGSLCAATVLPFEVDQSFATGIEVIGDTLRIVGGAYNPGTYSTDGTKNISATGGGQDLWVGKYVFCPTVPSITSDALSPATVNVCRNGIIEQIIGEKQVIPGSSLPPVYIDGILGQQSDIELKYQWQTSDSPGGPWTDIAGPIGKQQNYTPAPTTINTYYRRLTQTADCCGGITVSTSTNIVSVIVSGDTAPTVDAGGTFYTCPGSPVTIGGSPAATGGTAPYNYSWNNGAFTAPNPSVSPTESTIYDLFVTDNNGCEQADQAAVIAYAANAGPDASVCEGEGANIGGTALQGINVVPFGSPVNGQYNIAYTWTPTTGLSCSDCPNPTATPGSNTDYTLTVTLYQPNGSSCQSTDMVNVGVVNAPTDNVVVPDTVLCLGEMAQLGSLLPPLSEPSISSLTQSSTDASPATAANLADGDFATGGHTNNGDTENITIDLGSLQTINQIQAAPLTGQTFGDGIFVEVSTDNVTYTQVASYTFGLDANTLTTISFNTQEVRYIRFLAQSNFRDVSLSEFYALYDYEYIWTPGTYLSIDGKSATFDAGNLEMPTLNPVTYTVTTNLGTCNFYDQVSVAVIEARADEDYCGPRTVGEPDRTPNIEETYSWTIITDPSITTGTGNFLGVTNEAIVPVSASVGGDVGYELTVSYTLNGSTGICRDTVIVPPTCGPFSCDIVTDDGGCPDFDNGTPTLVAVPGDNNPDNWTYSWTSNMGMVGLDNYTSQRVMLTDNITRTYTVTITSILDPTYSCSETIEANSASFAEPVFSATSPVASCAGTPVNIGDPANNPGLTYAWSNAESLNNAAISYPEATVNASTTFSVTVTDDVTGCKVENTVRVEVPLVAYAGEDLNVCDNGTVTIGGPPTAGYTYSWAPAGSSWQNGTGPTDAQPEVFVAVTTDFYVTVTDDTGTCSSIDTITVTVEPLPPSFTLPDLSYCPSQGADLVLGTNDGTTGGTNQVPTGYNYVWTPALVSDASEINPTVNTPLPPTSTVFEVFASTPGGCNQRATQTINPSVTPPLVASNQTICLNETLMIGDDANSTAGGETYTWSPLSDLNNAMAANPIFTPSSAGTFTYTVTKTLGGCSTTNEVTITVNDLTAPTLTPQTICEGESVQIGIADDPVLSYSWSPTTNLDNAFISDPTFSGTTSTNYTLTVIDGNGCTAETSTRVTVNPSPAITITSPDIIVCDPNATSLTINAGVNPVGSYAYRWIPNQYLSSPNVLNPEFFVPAAGDYNYNLEVIDQGTGCSLFNTTMMRINYNAVPTVTATSTEGTCNGFNPNDDAVIQLTTNGNQANYSLGASYTGPAYNDATNTLLTGGSGSINGLMHNTQYTLRVFNGTNDCFADYTITTTDITCPVGGYSIGNRVFYDDDNSGDQNGTENGVDGVVLQLLNSDGSVYDSDPSIAGIQVLSVTSANGGYYRFDNLPAGNYIVEVNANAFASGAVLENYISSTGTGQEANPNSDADLNDNGLDTPVAGAIRSGVITLGGVEPLGETEPAAYTAGSFTGTAVSDAQNNLTVDFGFYRQRDLPDCCDEQENPCPDEPCHFISYNIYFGNGVTNDSGSNSNASADADTDDGLLWGDNLSLSPGGVLNLPILIYNNTGNDAYMRIWIDWNDDGDYDDAGEQVADETYLTAVYNGSFTVHHSIAIPVSAVQNQNLALRMRLSTDDTNSTDPCGNGNCADDGEIEDYLLRVTCPTNNCRVPVMTLIRRS